MHIKSVKFMSKEAQERLSVPCSQLLWIKEAFWMSDISIHMLGSPELLPY